MKKTLCLLLLAGVAHAAPVKPPTGWLADPAAAVSMTQKLGALPHFGGLSSVVTTEVYRAPAGGSSLGSLFVTHVIANSGTADAKARNAAAAAELADLQAAAVRSGGKTDGAKLSRIDEAKLLVGEVIWQDDTVITYAGMIVTADATHVVAVHGECVLAKDAAKDMVTACRGALASMDPQVPPATRVELELVAPGSSPGGGKPATMQPPSDGSSSPGLIDADHRPGLPPIAIPQTTETDRRPIYVGLGLIVLAAIFWWNRKQREKLEADYEERTGGKRDRDADDLHAAAEDVPDKAKADDKDDTKEEKA